MSKLVIATRNAGKIKELEELLADLPVSLCGLSDLPETFEPEETGATFGENAALKARSYAEQTGLWALADDSGLAVEVLNGAPGVFSARYAGANASEARRIEKLLEEIAAANNSNRRAAFVCAAAVADENGAIRFTAEGVCSGEIALAPRGVNGFGYDPVFIPEGFSATFGELSNDIKQQISHRKQAISKIIQQLRRFYASLS